MDRGISGYRIMQEMLNDRRFVYLKGNHEAMFAKSMYAILHDSHSNDIDLHLRNGGQPTLYAWKHDGRPSGYIEILSKLPVEYIYDNDNGQRIILTHAGYPPECRINKKCDEFLWNRDHIQNTDWPEKMRNVIMVHGHTPIQYIDKHAPVQPILYCNKHKIDIDLGTYRSGKVALLNLNTLQSKIFY
jgi:hypothetical protein